MFPLVPRAYLLAVISKTSVLHGGLRRKETGGIFNAFPIPGTQLASDNLENTAFISKLPFSVSHSVFCRSSLTWPMFSTLFPGPP